MREAGYANGFDIEFRTGVGDQTLVQAVQAYLKEVGINAKITVVEGAGAPPAVAKQINRGIDLTRAPPLAFADAEQPLWLFWLRIGTMGAWEDQKATAMYNRVHVEMDLATRIRLLQEIDAYLYEQLPIVPIVHVHDLFAVNKKIDFKPTPGNYNLDPARRLTWMPGY
jgi:ABC-type transport system substrate-binding protein